MHDPDLARPSRSTCLSSTPSPRTTGGGVRASPSGPTSPRGRRCSRPRPAALPASSGFYDLRVPEVRGAGRARAQNTGSTGSATTTTGSRQAAAGAATRRGAPPGRTGLPFLSLLGQRALDPSLGRRGARNPDGPGHAPEDDARIRAIAVPGASAIRATSASRAGPLLICRAATSLLPDPAGTILRTWARRVPRRREEPAAVAHLRRADASAARRAASRTASTAPVEFPPHQSPGVGALTERTCRTRRRPFPGKATCSYHAGGPPRPYIDSPAAPGLPVSSARLMTGWDNTPRRQRRGYVFLGATPERYGEWLAEAVRQTRERHPRTDASSSSMHGTSGQRAPTWSPTSGTNGPISKPPKRRCGDPPRRRLPQARQPRSRRLGGDRAATDRRTLRPGGTRDPAACKRSRWA